MQQHLKRICPHPFAATAALPKRKGQKAIWLLTSRMDLKRCGQCGFTLCPASACFLSMQFLPAGLDIRPEPIANYFLSSAFLTV